MILYLDTSALVKLYVEEDVRRAVREAEVVAISEIGFVEARSAFARREREGAFSEEGHDREVRRLRRDFDERYLACPVTGEVVARAGELVREHALRAYDAVHLATALALRDEARESSMTSGKHNPRRTKKPHRWGSSFSPTISPSPKLPARRA